MLELPSRSRALCGSLSHLSANQRAKMSGILLRDWPADQFLCLGAQLKLGRRSMISLCSFWASIAARLNAHSTSPTNSSPISDLPRRCYRMTVRMVQCCIASNIICLTPKQLSRDASARTEFPGANKGSLDDLKRRFERHTPLGCRGKEVFILVLGCFGRVSQPE